MPLYVVVSDDAGEPIVLVNWVAGPLTWADAQDVRDRRTSPAVFRDRVRAKRLLRRRGLTTTARVIPLDRL